MQIKRRIFQTTGGVLVLVGLILAAQGLGNLTGELPSYEVCKTRYELTSEFQKLDDNLLRFIEAQVNISRQDGVPKINANRYAYFQINDTYFYTGANGNYSSDEESSSITPTSLIATTEIREDGSFPRVVIGHFIRDENQMIKFQPDVRFGDFVSSEQLATFEIAIAEVVLFMSTTNPEEIGAEVMPCDASTFSYGDDTLTGLNGFFKRGD